LSALAAPELHAGALESLELADAALAHVPDLGIDAPHRTSELGRQAFEAMLGHDHPGARLHDAVLADAHDGMTSRNRWLLRWNDAGQAAGLPAAVFVKATPDGPYLRETLAVLHMAENEVRFYKQIAPELGVIAPRAHHASSYRGGRFMLVLDDLEAQGMRPYSTADECSIEHVRAVVMALATLHASYWQSTRLRGDLVWVRPRTARFGFEWHQRSFHLARRQYLEAEAGACLPPEIVALLRRWDASDRQVYAYWDRLPATVLHGDSHHGNTFSRPDGSAGLFDWQVIYRGHGLREVAYFLLGALDDAARRRHEREVVDLYLDELARRQVRLGRQQAWRDYCLFALDRLDAFIKTVTRGGYGHDASGLERARRATLGALIDNDVPGLLDHVLRHGRLA
jgi:hypothetical protein